MRKVEPTFKEECNSKPCADQKTLSLQIRMVSILEKIEHFKTLSKKMLLWFMKCFQPKIFHVFCLLGLRVGNSQYQQLFYRARYLLHLFLVDIDPLQDRLDT